MKYTKPAITFSDQASQLMKRGLVAPDEQSIIERLEAVSYCRLSAYWHPFRRPKNTLQDDMQPLEMLSTRDMESLLGRLDEIGKMLGGLKRSLESRR